MITHRMHPSGEIFGEEFAQESHVSIDYQIGGQLEAIWIRVHEAGTDTEAIMEIPKATFDRFIAEYLSAHGQTWIG